MMKGVMAACVAITLAGLLGTTTAARAEAEPLKKRAGGAPSPEMNTLLGLLVVAGTIVFIKSGRGNKAEAEDAAA